MSRSDNEDDDDDSTTVDKSSVRRRATTDTVIYWNREHKDVTLGTSSYCGKTGITT